MRGYFRINDNIGIETSESPSLQDVFKEITYIRSVVGDEKCGKCKSVNITPNFREVTSDNETNQFYELRCVDCGAVLQLGQHKTDSTLYKKKVEVNAKGKAVKTKDGEVEKAVYLKDGGWKLWNRDTKQME